VQGPFEHPSRALAGELFKGLSLIATWPLGTTASDGSEAVSSGPGSGVEGTSPIGGGT
jgi:hypothetical protein